MLKNNKEPKSNQSRQIFSVSKNYEEVIEILNNLPPKTKSAFICKAILEKQHRDHMMHSQEAIDALKPFIEEAVANKIEEMTRDNFFLIKGNPDTLQGIQVTSQPIETAQPINEPSIAHESKDNQVEIEDASLSQEELEEYDLILELTNSWD